MRRLNIKVLLVLVLLILLGGAGAAAIWYVQWTNQTQQFLADARAGVETLGKGEIRDRDKLQELFKDVCTNFSKYLGRTPDDDEVRREFTFFSADHGFYDQTTLKNLRKIREQTPDDLECLKKLTIALFRQKEFQDALTNIDLILMKEPEEPLFTQARVVALRELARTEEIVPWLDSMIREYPQNLSFYTMKSQYLLSTNRRDLVKNAEDTINLMVRNNRDSGKAHLIRAIYFREQDSDSENVKASIRNDLRTAYELTPDDPMVLMHYAEVLATDENVKDLDQSKELAQKAIEKASTEEMPYRVLASIQFGNEDITGGLATLDDGIAKAVSKDRLLEMKVRICLSRNDVAGARSAEQVLRDQGRTDWFVDYLSGLSDLAENTPEKNKEALTKLQRARDSVPKTDRRWSREVTMALSLCHRQLNDMPHAISSLRETIDSDSTWYTGRLMLASLLAADEQFQAAAEAQLEALRLPNADPSLYEGVVYWMLQAELRQNVRLRNWTAYRNTLAAARKLLPNSERLLLLEAWGYALQGELVLASQTMDSLSSEVRSQLSNQAIQVLLIETALRQNDLETAEQKIAQLAEDPANTAITKVLTARLWIQRKDPQATEKILGLLRDLDQIPEKERADFAVQVLKILWTLGSSRESLEGSQLVAARWPDNLEVQLGIFDAAVQVQEFETSNEAREAIRRLDGTGLFTLLADGITNMTMANQEREADKRNALYEKANLCFTEALQKRPDWGWAWFLKGRLQLMQEQYTEAASSFENSIKNGENNPVLYENILLLLNQKGYVAESQTILQNLNGNTGTEESEIRFQRISSLLALRQRRFDDAVKVAREVFVKMDRNDTTYNSNYEWIAVVFSSRVAQNILENRTNTTDHRELLRDAEFCFDRAVANPEVPLDIRFEQFRFMILIGQRNRVPELLEQEAATLPEVTATELRANVMLLLGDFEKANEYFNKLLELAPYNITYMQQAARFFTDMGRHEQLLALARTHLANTEAPPEVLHWARQNFAVASISLNRIDPLLREEAKKLIDQNLADQDEQRQPHDRLDLRLKAELYAADGQIASRKVALDIAGDLAKNFKPSLLEEELLYGKMLLLTGDKVGTNRYYEQLRARYPDSAEVLSAYSAALLATREYREAKVYIDQLIAMSPDSSQAIQYRLQRLFLIGDYDELVKETGRQLERVKTLPDSKYSDACLAFGKLLAYYASQPVNETFRANLSKIAIEAEACFRQASQNDPNCGWAVPLASLMIRNQRIDEALALIQSRSATGNEADCTNFLIDAGHVATQFTPAHTAAIDAFIQEILTRFGRTYVVLGGLAEYRITQGRYDEAEAIYREVLKTTPNSLSTLNNLAYLWAVQKKNSEEAMQLINQAILFYGEQLQLRDTRATIWIAMNEPEKALKDLEGQPTETLSVVNLFHRSVALLMLGKQAEAQTTFVDAKMQGLTPEMLRTLELDVYRQLDGQLQ